MKTLPPQRSDAPDAVMREVRATKERLARKFDFDIRRIATDARARQGLSGHRVVQAKPGR